MTQRVTPQMQTHSVGYRIGRFAIVGLLPLAIISGCAKHSENDFTVGSVQSTYKTKHPIVIDEQEKFLDVPVAASTYKMGYPTKSAIIGFANRYKDGANGAITVMIPSGSANEAAARRMLPKVASTLTESGIPLNRIRSASYRATDLASSPIRLSFTALAASVKKCGSWPEDLADGNNENQNYHNFGCASQNNLAAQIANPADLLGPRAMSPIDAERRNAAIEAYRTGNVGTTENIGTVFE